MPNLDPSREAARADPRPQGRSAESAGRPPGPPGPPEPPEPPEPPGRSLDAGFGAEQVRAAARAIHGRVRRTPLVEFPVADVRIRLWLKLECLQVTGAFKARGASYHMTQLSPAQRAAGVVAVSSGNHAKAVAWAARLAGVEATVCMPQDAYPSKIEAARRFGAEVFLGADRDAAEARARELADAGRAFVPPYDHPHTIAGQGTVGLEILEQRPSVDGILVPVGGGGLLAGISVVAAEARARARGGPRVVGVEPSGAAGMARALEAGRALPLERVASAIQGLTPPGAGALNHALVAACGTTVAQLDDAAIYRAQARIVRAAGWSLEPAGAAAAALVFEGALPAEWLEGRSRARPLELVAVLSGGNPDVEQLASLRR